MLPTVDEVQVWRSYGTCANPDRFRLVNVPVSSLAVTDRVLCLATEVRSENEERPGPRGFGRGGMRSG